MRKQRKRHPRASNKSKRKTSGSSKNNAESSNVVDVDDYHYDDVIVIDFPALCPKSDRKSRFIICVDDDNDGVDVECEESSGKLKDQWEKAFSRRKLEEEKAQELLLLQKKKDAESSLLQDIERRQKQRIEEVRGTQKQDEDILNLKEELRAKVKSDLSKLELTCRDMASVLSGLGIQVKGGANEVRVATKRALLSFHPDRAFQSDIRQQVEAEEKFKLINRMKEKFA
ncbi:hypothetical protein DCAR_0727233 [Daucus carota subsp. sativus]|uniref:Uncharacterized protein n=1 Tax=Daucus carota subsp. sativus TaxID=79200 RepID=A0A161WQK1_DAUCS|nr:PREDICTED: uncharacterized protein LOC108193539 [Daucus carota subsp. sativus]WOH07799.1 hypothetical protein DCAR_0727233 [Daucus carota subsp. sativus]